MRDRRLDVRSLSVRELLRSRRPEPLSPRSRRPERRFSGFASSLSLWLSNNDSATNTSPSDFSSSSLITGYIGTAWFEFFGASDLRRRHMKKKPRIRLTINEQPSTLATTAMMITNSSDSAGAFGDAPMFETIVSVFPPLLVTLVVVEPADASSVVDVSTADDVVDAPPPLVVDVLDFGVTVVVVVPETGPDDAVVDAAVVVVVGVVDGGRVVEPVPDVVDPPDVLVVTVVVVLGAGVVVVVRVTVDSSVVVGIATGMLEMALSCDELSPATRCRRGV